MNSRYDVAIAGGGIVGAMLALLLAARARVPAAGILPVSYTHLTLPTM
jgi:glycine/D-amino acid oxidase-like deaminating enzyme